MPRFDAYTATTRSLSVPAATRFARQFMEPGDRVIEGRGYHRFGAKYAIKGRDGSERLSVLWGGEHGDLVMIESKGERTPEVVAELRGVVRDHRCTRADSCEDFDELGAWDRLLGLVLGVKESSCLRGERRGDWDYPEDGRTMYLGAPSSAVRARLYEKGKEPELRHLGRENWVRLEVQVRPVGVAKHAFAQADAVQVWGATAYTRELAGRCLNADVERLSAVPYRKTERDRALGFMCAQYGSHLLSLKEESGDWQCVGLTLRDMIVDQAEIKERRKHAAR